MSAVVGFFIVETGARSGALVGLYATETVAAAVSYVDLAGNLAPAVSFAADLTVVAAGAYGPDESVYPATSAAEGNAPSLLTLGSQIGILSNGRITHIRYWKASGMQPSRNVSIWDDAGILLFNAVSTGVPGWNLHEISPPLAVSVGDIIRVSYGYSGSGADGNFGFTNSAVWADTANLDFISGCYQPGSADSFPGIIVTDSNYYADIVYQQQLDVVVDLAGGLAPSLAFGADLTVVSAGGGHLYWRFTLDATQPGFGGYTLAEVQFRTAIGVPLTPTGGTPSAADTYPGLTVGPPGIDPRGTYDAAKACDGNVTTMWSSNGPPAPVQWWAYTYATPQDIVEFAITARGDGFALYTQTPVKITPQWSDDGVTWTSWPQLISDNWTFEGQTQVFRNPAVSYVDLAGNLSPAVTFAASLTVDADAANYVDLSGNLGGVSQYGRLKYGLGHYSRIDAFTPILVASTLDIVGTDELAGNLAPSVLFAATTFTLARDLAGGLAPSVTFAGDLSLVPYADVAGDLAPSVIFNGDLGIDQPLAGDLAPIISFAGDISFDIVVRGDLPFTVIFAAGEMISGPLWQDADDCPVLPWTETEPCLPPVWVDAEPCVPPWNSTAPAPPTLWTPVDPCDVEWEDSEPCNG